MEWRRIVQLHPCESFDDVHDITAQLIDIAFVSHQLVKDRLLGHAWCNRNFEAGRPPGAFCRDLARRGHLTHLAARSSFPDRVEMQRTGDRTVVEIGPMAALDNSNPIPP